MTIYGLHRVRKSLPTYILPNSVRQRFTTMNSAEREGSRPVDEDMMNGKMRTG